MANQIEILERFAYYGLYMGMNFIAILIGATLSGVIFTVEPRLEVQGHGIVTIEEMVVIRKNGAEYLAEPQKDLYLIN